MQYGDAQDRARRAQEEIRELQEARLRVSEEVAKGKPGTLEEDQRIRERLVKLARLTESGGLRRMRKTRREPGLGSFRI